MILNGLLIVTVFIVLPLESHALSPFYSFRHLYEQSNGSPSPSPSHEVNLASGGSNFQQSCDRTTRSCQLKNITACLTYSQSGLHEEISLFVQNNGENLQHVKIKILPANNMIKEIDLPSHQMNTTNISPDVDLNSAIVLTTGDGDCVIHTAVAPPPENHHQKYSSYGTYITPINGAYLVFSILIIGGILTFFKLRPRSRHLEGVPYHELEMGNSIALNVKENENEKENWTQDWDDGWDDEKPVKFSGDNNVIVEQINGFPTKLPNSAGRRKERND